MLRTFQHETNAIAISSLAEVNVLALTLGLVFVVDQLGNVTGANFNDQNSNHI